MIIITTSVASKPVDHMIVGDEAVILCTFAYSLALLLNYSLPLTSFLVHLRAFYRVWALLDLTGWPRIFWNGPILFWIVSIQLIHSDIMTPILILISNI